MRSMCSLTASSNQPPIPNAAYGPSKVMVNWLTVRINSEESWLNAFVLDPGWVQTDLGNGGAHHFGPEQAETPADASCDGMIKVISESTKEKNGGKMIGWEGGIRGY
jgi:NAD(P)-dependent dehydrogenase (short-subunit alcohol dehydrogenase family)